MVDLTARLWTWSLRLIKKIKKPDWLRGSVHLPTQHFWRRVREESAKQILKPPQTKTPLIQEEFLFVNCFSLSHQLRSTTQTQLFKPYFCMKRASKKVLITFKNLKN